MSEIAQATVRHLQIAPRKVRLLTQLIRGKSVSSALAQLQFSVKGARVAILTLLKSAIANAKEKKMATDTLVIKDIIVNSGTMAKRFRPRAFGRAATIRKRNSHVTIILADAVEPKKKILKNSKSNKQALKAKAS